VISLLYLVVIVAGVYCGFSRFEWWAVLPLGAAFAALFFLSKPQALSFGLREGGIMYLARFLGLSAVLAIPVVGFGRLLAYADFLLGGR
jgi:hypothetical protein